MSPRSSHAVWAAPLPAAGHCVRSPDPLDAGDRSLRFAVRVDGIASDDIVELRVGGRVILGRVTEVSDGVVYFDPTCAGAGWRHAKPRQIVAHWRKAGRQRAEDDDEREPPGPIDGQLSFPGGSE